jgi:insertion element IS1 protein InsB
MEELYPCPRCKSTRIVKNGSISTGKKKYQCNDCLCQFVKNPQNRVIDQATWELIDKLLLERLALAAISRVTNVSENWIQHYVNKKYKQIPQQLNVGKKKKGRLTLECDEMWSFVRTKENKQWIWLAIDRETREIVGLHVGDRSRAGARALWKSLPAVYRQCAVSYTDFWDAYGVIFPSKRHRAVGKETGQTSHIERVNNTFRQRIGRLVRKTLSFSKKTINHIGAIWNFVHHYNKTIAPVVAAASF